MGQRHILHCDCNCFYASVEMQEHPELRGKSIAVCGDPEARHGIVLTASYPAKRMGVKTGMPIWEAKQHCRDLIIVPASFGKYQKYSGYVREVFNDYTDQVESFGLDEAWLDITGSVGLFGSPVKIAKEISVRIKRELGITVSIGVSFNKITAKLGSDYKKPDAITVIEPDTYKQIVYPLPVGDLLYVGNATQRKLGSYGIRTIGQLAETNPEVLKGWFGVMGYTLSAFARGLDQTPVAKQDAHSAIKSVGNSATTPRDLTTDEDVLSIWPTAYRLSFPFRRLRFQFTAILGISEPDTFHEIGCKLAVKKIIRRCVSVSIPPIPEVESQPGDPFRSTGLPAVIDTIWADTILFKVKDFLDVVPGIAADTHDIEKGFVVGIILSRLLEHHIIKCQMFPILKTNF